MKRFTLLKWMLTTLALLFFTVISNAQYSGTGTFFKITSIDELTNGYYVVVNSGDAFAMNNIHNGTYLDKTPVVPSSGTIVDPSSSIVWKFETNGDGYSIYNEASSKFISYTGSSNNVQIVDSVATDNQRWTISYASSLFSLANLAIPTRILQYNSGSPRFACYTSVQQKILLYKMETTAASTVITPSITPSGIVKTNNTYFNTADVTMASTTSGASIYYTLNGDVPTTSSNFYSAPVTVTSTTTFKAIAVKAGMDNSAVAEKTITIVAPATATVPYTEAFSNTLGDWYNYEVAGVKPWYASTNGVVGNGYGGGDVESWLISPKFMASSSGLVLSFNYASKYAGNSLLVKVSNDYTGYGSPASATWTTVETIAAPAVQDDAYTVKSSGNIVSSATGSTYFALVYDTSAAPYSDWRITNANVDVVPIVATPTITVTEVEVPAMLAETGKNDSEVLTVSSANLTGNIALTLSGADSGLFTLSTYSITPVNGTVTDIPVTITYTPLVAGSHAAIITLSSAGAVDVVRNIKASATSPVVPGTIPNIIISEVYGGGGNSGATLKNDFIELYNTTNDSIGIGGWSVQYFSATGVGTATNVFVIPEGKYIPGKKHFLIQAAAGTGGTVDLSAPDAISTLALSGSNGKIILYTAAAAQSISDLVSITGNVNFKDYVPYGSTAVPVWGTATVSTTSTTSASRKQVEGVYGYNQDIGADFEITTPNPENTGLSTAINSIYSELQISAFNNQICFNATAGERISLHNAAGQLLICTTSIDGNNILKINKKGVMIVKVGSRIAKVIL